MIPAFWDASALVPLCVAQQPTPALVRLSTQHQIVVWWGTPVEVESALQRLGRMGQLTLQEHGRATRRFDDLRQGWHELQPSHALRDRAELFLKCFPLKAADALQLAAAWTWCAGAPEQHLLISADIQLSSAARQVGFETPLD